MLSTLLSGDGTTVAVSTTRAQLPLLLAQAANLSTVQVGEATETDEAFPIAVVLGGAAVVQVGQATETDEAHVITVNLPADLILPVGLVTETDEAFAVTFVASGDSFVGVGTATETDEAFAVTFHRTFLLSHNDRDLSITPHVDGDLIMTPVEVE